jgi:hypothetical protein
MQLPPSSRKHSRPLRAAAAAGIALQCAVVTVQPRAAGAQSACLAPDVLRRAAAADSTNKDAGIVVKQICVNGEARDEISNASVLVDAPTWPKHPDTNADVLQDKTTFSQGITVLGAPPTIAFDLVTARSVTHVYPGTQLEKYALAQSEATRLIGGKAGFWVKAASAVASALGNPTFGVLADNIYCLSKDTVFSVELQPKKTVTVSVTEGTVDITIATAIRLTAEGALVDGIRDADVVTAGQTTVYPVPSPPHVFPNAAAARAFYLERLQDALGHNDRPRIEDWTFDLHRLGEYVPPYVPPVHVTHSALPYVAGAIVAGVILGVTSSHTTTTTRATPVPVTAAVNLQGLRIRAASNP